MRAVTADEIELGAPLAWSVYDRAGKLLFVQGMVLVCQAHLDIILERGLVVPESRSSGGVVLPAAVIDASGALAEGADAAEEADDTPRVPEVPVFRAMQLLRRELRGPGLKLNWNNPQETQLEAWLSRGDRRMGEVILGAWQRGARFTSATRPIPRVPRTMPTRITMGW